MNFSYQAMTKGGQPTTGVLSAGSLAEVRRILREQGMFLVKADASSSASSSTSTSSRSFSRRGISKNDLLNLTSQLAIMAQAGVDIASSLRMLSDDCPNPRLKEAIEAVHERVSAGEPVSDALQKQSHIFGEAYVASVAAGEASGRLSLVLSRLAHLLRADIRLASTLRGMLAYPIVLLVVSVSVLIALIFFVLPMFAEVFGNMGVPLPTITQVLLDISGFLTGHLWIVLAVLGMGIASVIYLLRTPSGRLLWDRWVIQLPMVGKICRYFIIGRTMRLFGTMVDSGVPILESLGLTQQSIRNSLYRSLFDDVRKDVLSGQGMSGAFARSTIVPSAVSSMLATGERTGNLATVLQMLGEHYETEAETKFRDVASMLEPALVIFVGGLVATVVLSLVLPMFDFTSAAGSVK